MGKRKEEQKAEKKARTPGEGKKEKKDKKEEKKQEEICCALAFFAMRCFLGFVDICLFCFWPQIDIVFFK